MIELEERVREGLGQLAGPIPSRVEVDAVLARGERLRRGRRARGWLVAGAAMVACGVTGAALLVGGPPGSRVIGTPAPPPSATASASAMPGHGPSIAPSKGARESLTFDAGDEPSMGEAGMAKVTVVRPDNAAPGIVVTGTTNGGRKIRKEGVVTEQVPFLAKLTSGTWVLVTAVKPLWAEGAVGGGLSPGTTYPLEDYGVVVVSGESGQPLEGFIWQDVQGRAWNDRGERVPSADLRLDGRRYVFAHSDELLIACSGEIRGESDVGTECGTRPTGGLGETGGGRADESGWEYRIFMVLPAGATDLRIDPQEGCASVSGVLDPGGQELVLLVCRGVVGTEERLPLVRYRDSAGKEHTYAP